MVSEVHSLPLKPLLCQNIARRYLWCEQIFDILWNEENDYMSLHHKENILKYNMVTGI